MMLNLDRLMTMLWPEVELATYNRNQFLQKLAEQEAKPRLDYTFDLPLVGDGWHSREHRDGVYWRFTGPGQTAYLYFPGVHAEERTLALSIYCSATSAHISDLQIRYNNIPLEKGLSTSNKLFFHIPDSAISSESTCVELTTAPPVKPCGDSRHVGLAVHRLEIY